jgi:hypothetical protein
MNWWQSQPSEYRSQAIPEMDSVTNLLTQRINCPRILSEEKRYPIFNFHAFIDILASIMASFQWFYMTVCLHSQWILSRNDEYLSESSICESIRFPVFHFTVGADLAST